MAITNGNDAARSKHLDALAAAAKRYVLEEILDVSEAVAAEISNINGIEYIVGTQTASTGAWTGKTKDNSLYAGKVIIYKLPYAGSGNATLNLTFANGSKSGAKNVYRYSSTRLTTQYAANYYIPLVFNGTYWFAFADYDTNYYDRIRFANAVATASGAVQAVCFVGTTDGTNFKQLSSGATFNINYPVYYNASAAESGAAMSTGLYFAIGSINLRTMLNDTEITFGEKQNLYLKGTLSGSTFTVHSDIITTTEPTSADGFTYMRVGRTYSTYQAYIAVFCNEFFAFQNGAFKKIDPLAESYSLPTASSSTKGGIKIGNGLSMSGDTLNVTLTGGAVLSTAPSTVEGGLWYETTSTAPIVKIFSGGSKYFLYTNQLVSPHLSLSSAAETISSGSSSTVTISHSGEGVISISNPNPTALTASYNSTSKVITLTNNLSAGDGSADVNIGISLTESGTYAADNKTLAVNCQATLRDPQLTVTPSTLTINTNSGDQTATAAVSYLGDGTVSVAAYSTAEYDYTAACSCSYDSNTKTLSVSYTTRQIMTGMYSGDYVVVSLGAAGSYDSATATVTMDFDMGLDPGIIG